MILFDQRRSIQISVICVPHFQNREWARILRKLHNDSLQLLLDQCVHQSLLALTPSIDIASFGDTVSLDTKHILA